MISVSSMKWFLASVFLPLFAHAFRIVQHAVVQTSKQAASSPSMDDLQELRFRVYAGTDGSANVCFEAAFDLACKKS